MERAEKRKLERERQKLNKHNKKEDAVNIDWYRSLPVSRKIFLGKLYEAKIIENDNVVAMIMDKCILAAMDDNTDLSIILMKKIIKEYNDYILEYKEYLDKYGNGGMDMIESTITRDEIKLKMKKMITNGVEKVKGMAELKKLYNLPAAELSETWIDCKVELDQEKKNKHKKVVVESKCEEISIEDLNNAKTRIIDYIMDGKSQDSCMCLIQDEFKLSINVALDLWNECMNKNNNTESYCGLVEHPEIRRTETEKLMCEPRPIGSEKLEFKNPSDEKIGTVTASYDINEGFKIEVKPAGLQVIDEVKVIKGTFGYYHKSKDGVRFSEGEELLNKDIVYRTKDEVIYSGNLSVDEINKNILILQEKIAALKNDRDVVMSKYDEFKQVFDL